MDYILADCHFVEAEAVLLCSWLRHDALLHLVASFWVSYVSYDNDFQFGLQKTSRETELIELDGNPQVPPLLFLRGHRVGEKHFPLRRGTRGEKERRVI